MESYEIGPESDPTRWSFTLEDGTVLQPENGVFPIDGVDTAVGAISLFHPGRRRSACGK
ncbi:MAG: hypothetical protein II776_05495 [Clostridia bacterium]|nr:hypothetical protein [Clostridia bacterium]